MNKCTVLDLGRLDYGSALEVQQRLVAERKQGTVGDHLLLVEHPHVITLGRNGHMENLLASDEILTRAGISFYPTDRGGDVTYHGPGQLVGYPILDLRDWRRDVGAYVRSLSRCHCARNGAQPNIDESGDGQILIPAGTFVMGDAAGQPDENPHTVSVSTFYLDKYAVTQELY